jgi:hypothetical protein
MDIIRTHSADRRRGLIRVDVCWCGSTGHPMSGKCRCSLAALIWPPSVLKQGLAFSGVMITTQTPGRSMSKELEMSLSHCMLLWVSHFPTMKHGLAMWNRAISRLGNEAWLESRVMTSETNDAIHSFFTVYTADGISFYIYIFLGFWQKLLWIGKTAEAASSEATAAKASARSVPTCLICWWGACCSMLDSKNAWEASFLIQIGSVRCPGRSSSRVEIQGSEIFQHTQHWNRDRNDVRKCRHRKCLLEPGRQS